MASHPLDGKALQEAVLNCSTNFWPTERNRDPRRICARQPTPLSNAAPSHSRNGSMSGLPIPKTLRMGDGLILKLEIKGGLPFDMTVEEQPA